MNPSSVLDLDHLRRYTHADPALESELVALFREQCALWLRALDPKGDAETWRSGAHALKGSARGIGAFALAEACEAAEVLTGEAGTPVARSVALETLRVAMNEALAAAATLEHRAATSFRKGGSAAR
jgi:HPt (histidine-containing phosphotransfer) domain-containing protein